MPGTAESGFDAAVVDSGNHTVALIQVKAHPVGTWATVLPRHLAKFAERVDFVLTIDPNCIEELDTTAREHVADAPGYGACGLSALDRGFVADLEVVGPLADDRRGHTVGRGKVSPRSVHGGDDAGLVEYRDVGRERVEYVLRSQSLHPIDTGSTGRRL